MYDCDFIMVVGTATFEIEPWSGVSHDLNIVEYHFRNDPHRRDEFESAKK